MQYGPPGVDYTIDIVSRLDDAVRFEDLDLERVQAAQAQPPTAAAGPAVSRASLQADLRAAQQRYIRLATRIQQLDTRLSELLGEHTWRSSGLGAPDDLQLRLDERAQDLDSARATNRALMTQLDATASG